MSEAKPPAIDTDLAAHTAEMLCLPQIVCSHRDCRRGNRCRWFYERSRLPHCVPALDDGERSSSTRSMPMRST